jgi:hypothetical protein
MSRYVAGLIHPGILKEINMNLLGNSVYVITLVYLRVTFRKLYVYYLFVWCSRLGLMRFPTSQSSATWSIHNPTLPWLVFNYMLWNDSFWMMRLWLNIFVCSKLCYSYCKWQFFRISSLLILSYDPVIASYIPRKLWLLLPYILHPTPRMLPRTNTNIKTRKTKAATQ